ncbi:MFS transporter [Roseibium sp. CAU 1637]|uniref:MFS transporter n=1 Tax=Roseibium limicola TaxID=2816037 RepID=A0A939J6N2_9HYPH|nr:MFS transporter [Roseibium limicola]MBO0347030.1 MFS transporter [Roseibium limicola]
MSAIRARRAVGAVFFVFGTDIGAWAARIPDFKELLGLSEGPLGALLLSLAVGSMAGFPIAGYLVDRMGAERLSKILAVALLLAFLSLPFGTVYVPLFAFCLFALGAVIGSLDVAMNAWGAEVEKELGRPIMSSYHGLYSLGAVAGAGGGAVALWLDLPVTTHYILWVLLMLPALYYALTTPWVSERSEPTGSRPPVIALPKGALVFVGIMCLAGGIGEGAVTDWAALYQIQELFFSESLAAITFAVYSSAMVVMRFSGDALTARFGPVRVAQVCGLAGFIGCALLVWGPTIYVVWLGVAIMGIGNAPMFPLAISRAAADPTVSKGAAIASVVTLGYGAFLFGPPVLGFVGEHFSLRVSFLIVAFISLVIVVLAKHFRVPLAAD